MRKWMLLYCLFVLSLSACGGKDNHPPTAAAQSVMTREDTPLTGKLAGTDPDQDPLTFSLSQQAAHGHVTVQASGAFTYQPAANFNGDDTFGFKVTDPSNASGSGVVKITVTPVNDAPTFAAMQLAGVQNENISGTLVAKDVDGDTLTYAVASSPTHGTLKTFDAQGHFTYQPNTGFHGTDSFSAKATDPSGLAATGTVTLKIDGPPQANDDVLAVGAGSTAVVNVLANDTDPEGDALTVQIVSAPTTGTATVTSDNQVSLTLPAGFRGFTRFSYRATDSSGLSSTATAVVFVGTPIARLSWTGDEFTAGVNNIVVSDFIGTWAVDSNLPAGNLIDTSSLVYRPKADRPAVGFRSHSGGAYVATLDSPASALLLSTGSSIDVVDIDVHSRYALYQNSNVLFLASLDGSPSFGAINAPNYCNGAFGPAGVDIFLTCTPPGNTFPPPTPYWAQVSSPGSLTQLAPAVAATQILPDGTGLLYFAARTDATGSFQALFMAKTATPGQEVQISGRFAAADLLFSFTLTADGQKVVYSAGQSTGCELYVSDLTAPGTSVQLNGPQGPSSCPMPFDLAPNSQRVVYWQTPVGQPLQEAVYETSLVSPHATTTLFAGGVGLYTSLKYDQTGTDLIFLGNVPAASSSAIYEWNRSTQATSQLTPSGEVVDALSHNQDWSILAYLVRRSGAVVDDERVMNRSVPGKELQLSNPAATSGVVNSGNSVFFNPSAP